MLSASNNPSDSRLCYRNYIVIQSTNHYGIIYCTLQRLIHLSVFSCRSLDHQDSILCNRRHDDRAKLKCYRESLHAINHALGRFGVSVHVEVAIIIIYNNALKNLRYWTLKVRMQNSFVQQTHHHHSNEMQSGW